MFSTSNPADCAAIALAYTLKTAEMSDLPKLPKIGQSDSAFKQGMNEYFAALGARITDGTPENAAFERKQIGELAEFIEANLLDELADQGCAEGFLLNGLAGLSRDFKSIEVYRGRVRSAACRQVWYKYNH